MCADSVGLYLEIHQSVLAEYSMTCSWADLIAEMGHTAYETAQNMCHKKAVPETPENYKNKVSNMQTKLFPNCGLIKGGRSWSFTSFFSHAPFETSFCFPNTAPVTVLTVVLHDS